MHVIGAEPDGWNINDGVGSTHLDPLRDAVRETGADLGLAHDGDADRCLAVTADGEVVDGDGILAVCALGLHEAGRLAGDTVVATVMSNLGFHHTMRDAGIGVATTAVGDRYVLETLRSRGLSLGGEQSGHLVFLDHATTGDGLLTGLMLMGRMAATGSSLAELAGVVRKLPQVLVNVPVADRIAVSESDDVARAVNAVEEELGEAGRVLLRPRAPSSWSGSWSRHRPSSRPTRSRSGSPRSSPPSEADRLPGPGRVTSPTMCGIVGYVGPQNALDVVLEGLRRLEYRGYDSAGVAVLAGGELSSAKKAGKVANLEKELAEQALPPATIGIGHTRWATHGGPTDRNAHPHLSADGTVAVIHNGIIENFAALRAEVEATGVEFASETDTEVVAHLLAAVYPTLPEGEGRLAEAMRQVSRRLEGAFTLVASHAAEPDTLVASRRNSPLVAGVGDGEYFLGSDVAAFIGHTRNALELGQDQVVEIDRSRGVTVTDFAGNHVEPTAYTVDWEAEAAGKAGYDWFMLKEIDEQPQAVADTLLGRLGERGEIVLDEVRISDEDLRGITKIFVIACGTAYHAGLIAKYAIEHWTRIPVEVELASEFRYRDPVLDRSTLVVVISQSGETMDTLMALRHAKEQQARVLAICNANGSTIPRESDAVLYTRAGPEVAVASTKGFLTQVVACYLVGLFLAQVRGLKYEDEVAAVVASCASCPTRCARCSPGWTTSGSWAGRWRPSRRSCSWAGTWATRWRWRARSSSRSWPTSTPRASPPVSSSTVRSR